MNPLDKPSCVCPVIGAFVRNWNDSLSQSDRDRILKPLLPLLLDTADPALLSARAWLATDWMCRVFAPAWLDKCGLAEHATRLRAHSPIVDDASAKAAQAELTAAESAAERAARSAELTTTGNAALSVAVSAAWNAASNAARSAAWSAALSVAVSVAVSVAGNAARSAAGSAALSAARSAALSAAVSVAESVARSVAESVAKGAAEGALADTVAELQASACDLVRGMCEHGSESGT